MKNNLSDLNNHLFAMLEELTETGLLIARVMIKTCAREKE